MNETNYDFLAAAKKPSPSGEKLHVQRVISAEGMALHPKFPSEFLRDAEAGLITELARQTALAGRKFVEWPKLTLGSDYRNYYGPSAFTLHAEVQTVPVG